MRKFISILLVFIVVLGVSMPAIAAVVEKKATSSNTKFVMDGKEISFNSAYLIDDHNYIQLRSVAEMLNGTPSQFNLYWDNDLRQAVIETGMPFTGEKPVYAGSTDDEIVIKNTKISILETFIATTIQNDGAIMFAPDNKIFFGITFKIVSSSAPLNQVSHYPIDFFKSVNGLSGVKYRDILAIGDDSIYQNMVTTLTIYYRIPTTEKITSISVSDGRGTIQEISVDWDSVKTKGE